MNKRRSERGNLSSNSVTTTNGKRS